MRGTLEGLRAPVLSLAFAPDGRRIVGSDDTTRARIWDLRTGDSAPIEGMGKVVRFVWRPDGAGFFAVELTRAIALYDADRPSAPEAIDHPEGLDRRYLLDAALAPDGRLVCVAEEGALVVVRAVT